MFPFQPSDFNRKRVMIWVTFSVRYSGSHRLCHTSDAMFSQSKNFTTAYFTALRVVCVGSDGKVAPRTAVKLTGEDTGNAAAIHRVCQTGVQSALRRLFHRF